MVTCRNCGMGAAAQDKFCGGCGTPLSPPPPAGGGGGGGGGGGRRYEAYLPSSAAVGAQRAVEHAECAICFEALSSSKTAVFTKAHARVCPHFFHLRCSQQVMRGGGSKVCPLCRASYDNVLEVPDLHRDPNAWFQVVDLNSDHKLSRDEVKEVLKAQLPIDYVLFEEQLPSLFRMWDINGDGTISQQELMHPQNGLITFVREQFKQKNLQAIPNIHTHKHEWFRYYDYDKSGTLEKEEVVRAVIQTFKMGQELERVQMMREIIGAVWGELDRDGSGTIEENEFFLPNVGLADTIIATLSLS